MKVPCDFRHHGLDIDGNRINRQLSYRVAWNAVHIQGGGKKTWVEVATQDVTKL